MKKQPIAIFGDMHLTDQSPKYEAQLLMLDWISKTFKDHIVIFTGDFFDKHNPHWNKSYEAGLNLFMSLTIQSLNTHGEVHFIAGNHEIGAKGNMLSPLKDKHENLFIYLDPEFVDIGGYQFYMAPFLKDRKQMIDIYDAVEGEVDFVVCHCHPKGYNNGQEETNFPLLKARNKFYGHYHEPFEEENRIVLGVPNTTRNGEQQFTKRYILIKDDEVKSMPMPVFFDISTIDYEIDGDIDELLEQGEINPLWQYNVTNAPSTREAVNKFKSVNLRVDGIEVVSVNDAKEDEEGVEVKFADSLIVKFDEFCKDENPEAKVADVARSFLSKTIG